MPAPDRSSTPESRTRPAIERWIEAWVAACARRPGRTLVLVLLLTVFFAGGLLRIRFETGILDWLPTGHPNVAAFGRMLESLDGVTNQELLWVELDPDKAARAGVETIHDELAVRAQQELIDYVRDRVPRIEHAFGLPHWFALVHSANRGGEAAAYRLPDSSFEFRLIWTALWQANRGLLSRTISEDMSGSYVGLVVSANPLTQLARRTGMEIEAAVSDYVADPQRRYDLFRDEYLRPIGLASGTATIDRILRRDVSRLLPLAAAAILAALILVFRRPALALAGIAQVVIGVVWTYGAMGYFGVPLNIVNVALVPLVFGCGVDYAIHLLNEYGQGRGRGASRLDGLRAAARASGVGIVLTTVTTAAGLLALVVADIPGIVQLGAVAAFGMTALALLSLTFLPALVALRPEREFPTGVPESAWIGGVMEWFARRRRLTYVLFVSITAAALFATGETSALLDPIRGNFRDDEPVMSAIHRMQESVGGAIPDFIIVEGDLADPRSIAAMTRFEERVEASDVLADQVEIGTWCDVLAVHSLFKNGSVGAVGGLIAAGGDPIQAIPDTRPEILAEMRAMNSAEPWRPLSSLFFDEEANLGVAIILVTGDAFDQLAGSRRLWDALAEVVAECNAEMSGNGDAAAPLRFSFLGYRTMAHLFFTTSESWLRILFCVSLAVSVLLVALLLRDRRAVIAIGTLMLATGAWWMGLVRLCNLHLSVFLLFPLIFVISIGSDHGLHLCWRLSRGDRRRLVWRTTGRAICFSALTDGVVFALFVPVRLVSASQMMLAVVLAVVAVSAATLLLVPAAYGGPGSAGDGDSSERST